MMMSFLNSVFIWLLPAVLIPLIIHFIHFRKPEKLAFSSIIFLEELQKTVVRRLKFREWWLMAIRTLLVLAFVFAFGQPFWRNAADQVISGSPIFLIIDSGTGMDRLDENGPLIDQAKEWAIKLVNGFPDSQQFVIASTTGVFPDLQILSKDDAIRSINRIQVQVKAGKFNEIVSAISESTPSKIILIGDTHPEKWKAQIKETKQKLESIDWIPVGNPSNLNLYFESVTIENRLLSANKPIPLDVLVRASGDEGATQASLSLMIGGQIQGEYQLGLAAGEQKNYRFMVNAVQTGYTHGELKITGDAYLSDNERFFTIQIPAVKNVAVIRDFSYFEEDALYFQALMRAANTEASGLKFIDLDLNEVQQVDSLNLSGIWLMGLKEIPSFLLPKVQDWIHSRAGLIITPSTQSDLMSYNNLFTSLGLSTRYEGFQGTFSSPNVMAHLSLSDHAHPITDDVFELPKGKKLDYEKPSVFAFISTRQAGNRFVSTILETELKAPLLLEERIQQQKVLISAIGAGAAWSNFSANAFFAPFWFKAAQYITAPENGGLNQLELGTDFEYKLSGKTEFVSAIMGTTYNETLPLRRKGGNTYALLKTEDLSQGLLSMESGKQLVYQTGLYLPAQESAFRNAKKDEIELIFGNQFNKVRTFNVNDDEASKTIKAISGFGLELWPLLAVFAFLLLLIESTFSIRNQKE